MSVPPGEAPLWVREKWVGLSLPLAQTRAAPLSLLTGGVLSGPKGLVSFVLAWVAGRSNRRSGFVVETRAAIAELEATSPEAAAWWRENAPHMMRAGKYFVFPQGEGDFVEPLSTAGVLTIPLLWVLLLSFLYASLLACVLAWFVLLSNICSNPRTADAATQHTTPYNCHGATVFISPVEDGLHRWLGPIGAVLIGLSSALVAAVVARVR